MAMLPTMLFWFFVLPLSGCRAPQTGTEALRPRWPRRGGRLGTDDWCPLGSGCCSAPCRTLLEKTGAGRRAVAAHGLPQWLLWQPPIVAPSETVGVAVGCCIVFAPVGRPLLAAGGGASSGGGGGCKSSTGGHRAPMRGQTPPVGRVAAEAGGSPINVRGGWLLASSPVGNDRAAPANGRPRQGIVDWQRAGPRVLYASSGANDTDQEDRQLPCPQSGPTVTRPLPHSLPFCVCTSEGRGRHSGSRLGASTATSAGSWRSRAGGRPAQRSCVVRVVPPAPNKGHVGSAATPLVPCRDTSAYLLFCLLATIVETNRHVTRNAIRTTNGPDMVPRLMTTRRRRSSTVHWNSATA